VPSLPRIRRTRPPLAEVDLRPREAPVAEVAAAGLTWINLEKPDPDVVNELRERFGWHPLDVEDVLSKRQRPKVDDYLDEGYDYCFPILDKIGHKLDTIEDDIDELRSEEIVRDISKVKQEIISYRKIVKPQRPALRLLERHIERFLPENLELYFDDLVDASERIWDQLDNFKEVVEALEDTNESVISHRQNDVLRILTVVSVVLLPLTLISGIFGMNVDFPGYGTHEAFWVIVGLMVAVIGGMVGFFKYKRWL
jgi:magnesium transporter